MVLPHSEASRPVIFGVGRLHEDLVADLQIGHEIDLLGALRVDVHGRIDEIDAAALQGRDQALEVHVHRLGLDAELLGQGVDHVDVEARQLAVLLNSNGAKLAATP